MKGLGSQVAESANVTDRVRDVMVLTVPRLAIDELEPMVEPDPWMPDDGCAKRFAKAFIFDDTPRMRVRDEVFDLMCLADPLVAELSAESVCEDPEIPEDGSEAIWADVLTREEAEVPYEVPEAACDAFAENGKGFTNQLMVLGIVETVAIFVMAFAIVLLGKI